MSRVRRAPWRSLALIALVVVGSAVPPPARAGLVEIFVTTTEDELNADGDCSLREAIEAANTDAAVDACPAGDPSFDFVYPPAGAAIALSQGPLVVRRGLGIYADGLTLSVAGTVAPQPLLVLDLGEEDFEFYGAWNASHPRSRLVGGRNAGAGGAVHVAGAANLFFADLVFDGHQATSGGAIGFGDTAALAGVHLQVRGSRFVGNTASGSGGAIGFGPAANGSLRSGSLWLSGNSFHDNHAGGDGGAVSWVAADEPKSAFGIQLQRLVFSSNSAAGVGGALYLPSGAGALANTLQVLDNHAADAGGAWIGLPQIDLATSAFVRNSAASEADIANLVLTTPAPILRLVAVSDAVLGSDCHLSGSPSQPMPNLGGDASCSFGRIGSAAYGPVAVQAAGLDPFAVPLPGSALVDAHIASACPSPFDRDLFGRTRPRDGDGDGVAACDIGPVETLDEHVFGSGFEDVQ